MSVPRPNTVRVLAVDHEQHVRELYEEFLSSPTSSYTFDVTLCRQGGEAVEAVRAAAEDGTPFSLVFIDSRLNSEKDGVGAAGKIRMLDPNIEIVVVTAHNDVTPEAIVSPVPPDDKMLYLKKPFTPEEIVQLAVALGSKWQQEIQLLKIHAELEREIMERTGALSETNEQLPRVREGRRRIEEELQKSEERYKNILENIEEGYFEVDLAGNFTFANDALCRIAGYDRDELIGMNNRDYTTPETAKRMYRVFSKTYQTGEPAKILDYDIFRKDGTTRTLELSASLMKDSTGKPAGFRGVVRDVTERKQAEEALRESEERYRSLFQNNHAVMLLVDPETADIVDANPAACSFYGWSHKELTSKKIFHINTLTEEQIFQEIERAKPEQSQHFLFRHRLARGEVVDVEVFSGPIILNGKKLLYSIVHDITERKQAIEALRDSEEKYRTVLEANPDPVVVYDIEGKVVYFNPAFTRVFGWSLGERLGKTMDLFVPEENWPETKIMIQRVLTGESFSGIESSRYTKEGKIIPVSISGAVLRDMDGKPVGSVINLRDISERKNLESQLLHAQKMEAVGTLAGGIAHDFNNLLQAIQGYTELLLMRKKEGEPGCRELQEVIRASKRGAELTQQLLTFSRKVESKRKPLDLNQEVAELRQLLERTFPRMIELEFILDPNIRMINADSAQLKQVIMNLAVNAKDAMPEGGKLVIETQNMTLDQEFCKKYAEVKPGEYVLLSMADTGHGMEKETLEHIFDPFYTTKEVGKGTGLGLAIVYGIIKNHEGYVMCYSRPGSGASFRLYLPALEAASEREEIAESQESKSSAMGGNETILLVDDEEFIRELGVDVLGQAGYTVLTASNGEQALEVYRRERERIALVILDLIMPGMGGSKCLEELLKITPRARVLIASGYSPDASTKGALEAGAAAFINKPYDNKQLLELVRKILDSS
ncbi:MAG: PAS domain S-box protein [Deltaproteobacteria bacterium]|nr:PAS domain S-box protein [Deltaproteobacteria bacterium]